MGHIGVGSGPRRATGLVRGPSWARSSLIAIMRERWNLGAPLTALDASARKFASIFTLAALGAAFRC